MRIILNADDFGYSDDTVDATMECFGRNALTSATIMPNMPATDRALAFAREHTEFSFGVHFTFTGEGLEFPMSDASDVPDLVREDGQFLASRRVRAKAMLGRIPVDQIEQEMEMQIRRLLDAGVSISHVDSHHHMHKYGAFRQALIHVLAKYDLSRVRTVQDVYLKRPLVSPTYWFGWRWRRKIREAFATTDHFYMPASAGDRTWGVEVLRGLKGDALEIGVHPGHVEPWRRAEHAAALAFAQHARDEGHQLISWRDVAASDSRLIGSRQEATGL